MVVSDIWGGKGGEGRENLVRTSTFLSSLTATGVSHRRPL